MCPINFTQILNIHVPTSINEGSLEELKSKFDFENYLKENFGKIVQENNKSIKLKQCPICGHHDCFVYYKEKKTWYCFGQHGRCGGSIVDFIMKTQNLDKKDAINYFKYDLCGETPNYIFKDLHLPEYRIMSVKQLLETTLPPVTWIVENLIPQGLAILASLPKHGKSWFVLQLCLAVSEGIPFLGLETTKSGVLYLALEDSMSRLKERTCKILGNNDVPDNFFFMTNAMNLSNGLIPYFEEHLQNSRDTKLIVIDTFQKIRGGYKNENAYAIDYKEVSMLKAFADKHNLCILIVHHLRKQKDNDIFNKISGTNGIMGAADTIFVLEKEAKDDIVSKLHITGRDVNREELMLVFENYQWTCQGNTEMYVQSLKVQEYYSNSIITALKMYLETQDYKWQGTASELLKELKILNRYLDIRPEKLAKELKKRKELLYNEDSIKYTPPPECGSNGKRIHTFEKIDQMEDIFNNLDYPDI